MVDVCKVVFCYYAKKASKSIEKKVDEMFSKYVFLFLFDKRNAYRVEKKTLTQNK